MRVMPPFLAALFMPQSAEPPNMDIKLLPLLVSVMVCLNMQAQSADGRYISRMTQDGTLYFINPQKLSKTEGIKNFEYDMTLLRYACDAAILGRFVYAAVGWTAEYGQNGGGFGDTAFVADFKKWLVNLKKRDVDLSVTEKSIVICRHWRNKPYPVKNNRHMCK